MTVLTSARSSQPFCGGIGLRQPHYAEFFSKQPVLGFVEVHSENFFGEGAALALLQEVRQAYPVSLHGVGLSLGSAVGIDSWHLEQLSSLVERVDPVRVSDHACFARARLEGQSVHHANDLLPIAFTKSSLDIMVQHVTQVQERLRRPIAVENLSAYLAWADNSIPEPEFLNSLAQRSGCLLLVDLNNVVVNALNAQENPVAYAQNWIDRIQPAHVSEIHLAGHNDLGDIVIDDHGSPVHEWVWSVYAHAIQRWGSVPTLIERDTNLPELDFLLSELQHAHELHAQHFVPVL